MSSTIGQYAVFVMGGEEFAIEIARVVEILPTQDIMPIPNLPEFLVGVIELRGRVIPVMDLRTRFHLKTADGTRDRIIILRRGRERLGIIVDDVNEILEIDAAHISARPTFFKGIGAEYIKGIGKTGKRMIVILNTARLLSPKEFSLVSEVLQNE